MILIKIISFFNIAIVQGVDYKWTICIFFIYSFANKQLKSIEFIYLIEYFCT